MGIEEELYQQLRECDWKKPYEEAIKIVEQYASTLPEKLWNEEGRQVICYNSSRIKSDTSIVEKCKKKRCELTLEAAKERLNDIAGYRIVCLLQSDVYLIFDQIKKNTNWKLVKKKDFIRKPKKTGYRSLHLIVLVPVHKEFVKVEIQLRTIVMDYWAMFEYKLQYKTERKKIIKKNEYLQEELKQCSSEIMHIEEHMQKVASLEQETTSLTESKSTGEEVRKSSKTNHKSKE